MTDRTDGRAAAAEPTALVFSLLNGVMAAGLGAALAGWRGAAAGLLMLIIAYGVYRLVPLLARGNTNGRAAAGPVRDVPAPLRALGGLLLIPFIPLATVLVFGLSVAWVIIVKAKPDLAERTEAKPAPAVADVGKPVGRFLDGFLSARALPLTAVNLLLLLTLGCVAIGIEVAFYAALLAVPIGICTMVMTALDAAREPEVPPAL